MSSTNKTTNLELNQWVGTDPVLMADFNADNAKIDAAVQSLYAAMALLPHIATGTYTGSGEQGSSHPNTLSFPFAPKFVFIIGEYYACFFIGGAAIAGGWTITSGVANLKQQVTWSGNSMSWYLRTAYGESSNWSAAPKYQLNNSNETYTYFAIG